MTHPFDAQGAYEPYLGGPVGETYNSPAANGVDPQLFYGADEYYDARLAAQQGELRRQQEELYDPRRAAGPAQPTTEPKRPLVSYAIAPSAAESEWRPAPAPGASASGDCLVTLLWLTAVVVVGAALVFGFIWGVLSIL